MTRWILNSAVIAAGAYGTYDYSPLNEAQTAAWMQAGPFRSRVGYEQTAQHLQSLTVGHGVDGLGIVVPLSREPSALAPGDEALVCRLRYRVADPATKGQAVPEEFELGLLRRLS